MKVSKSTFLLPLFSASTPKPSMLSFLDCQYLGRGQTEGLRGLRTKQFRQGLHQKQLQGNEASQLHPTQLQAAATGTVPASRSPLPAPSPLGQLQPPHGL